ncbi:hypothetical protein NDR87_25570 [Nocardia sp. CDC159]|uniref:Uncharacterized protein n=1 Tax=Nocardia pulmonis TaxID=2951408 RepID=A0A9X2E6Q8_9NOCA|nr:MULTISPECIES: hypothetical protein [Nocardia]MCM6774814.1 hypothetical protein [Nocardia pulmonis]MCM6789745.1 hypothetical protein [Nocardia sp. CDC159]
MFIGRTLWASNRPVAAPALAVYRNTLVLVWSTQGGTMYVASGMEVDGVVRARALPFDSSLQRPSLSSHAQTGLLYLGYMGTDNQTTLAWSDNGVDYQDRRRWLEPAIGGPAMVSDNVTLWVGYTAQNAQLLQTVRSHNPPYSFYYVSPEPVEYSVDTPAVMIHPSRGTLLSWTGTDAAYNHLNARYLGVSVPPTKATFSDRLVGGPNLFSIGGRYVAGYSGLNTNIYMLFDIDNLNEGQAQRWKFADASPWPPAVATINGITYVAWFGTDGENKLNFADLGSMPTIYRGGSG